MHVDRNHPSDRPIDYASVIFLDSFLAGFSMNRQKMKANTKDAVTADKTSAIFPE